MKRKLTQSTAPATKSSELAHGVDESAKPMQTPIGLLSPLVRLKLDLLHELLSVLEAPPFDVRTQHLCQRLGISSSLDTVERWALIGVELAVQQPEYQPEHAPRVKRSRGRPRGSTKPILERAYPSIRAALDAYEAGRQPTVTGEEMVKLGKVVKNICRLLPPSFDPRVEGAGLTTLIEAAGGMEAVKDALNLEEEDLLRLIDVESRLKADRERERCAWREAIALVKKTASNTTKGEPVAAYIKALNRLKKDLLLKRLVDVMAGARTK